MSSSGTEETVESSGTDIGNRTNSLSWFREWVLVDADRRLLATIIAVGTAGGFFTLNALGVIAFVNDDSVTRLAGGMIAGTFSVVTLVVSINQLILSREFRSAGEAEERLEGVLSFRESVADLAADPVSPASPSRLLGVLLGEINDRAGSLAEAAMDCDEEVTTAVTRYTNRVQEDSGAVHGALEHTEFGTFRTVSAAVDYHDGWQLYVARQLQGRYGDHLSHDATEALAELIEGLKLFNVAREHLKTTYFQRELTRFSQLTIYCGVPAILSAMVIGFLYADLGGPAISTDLLPFVVTGLVAVVVSPLALLASYILRAITVARRTASVGPMLPRKGPDESALTTTSEEESSTVPGGTDSGDE